MEKPSVVRPQMREARSFSQLMNRLEELQGIKRESALWKDKVDITVDTGGFPYFLLHPLSDLHIGAIGSDTQALRKHLSLLTDLPVYTVLLGDLGDMFSPTKHPEGMMGDVLTPDEQMVTLRAFFREFQPSILATVQDPSHMDWVRQVSGIEPQRELVEDLNIPLLQSGGHMNLNVNGIDYKLLLFHKIARFNSSLNITNAGKRMLDMEADADVVISGHTHIGAAEKLVKRDKKPLVVNLGTFKTSDDFGTRQGMVPNPQVFFPTLFFDARRKNVEMIEDVDAARQLIESLGDLKKKQAQAALGIALLTNKTLNDWKGGDPD